MRRTSGIRMATALLIAVPAHATAQAQAPAPLLVPLTDDDRPEPLEQLTIFAVGDDVYLDGADMMLLRTPTGPRSCRAGIGSADRGVQHLVCGTLQLTLTSTGPVRDFPARSEMYDSVSGAPATLVIGDGHRRQVLTGLWQTFRHEGH